MVNRRKLRRLKEPKKAFELGAGLTTYENVTDEELCRLFRTHEHPLVEELVARLGDAADNSSLMDEETREFMSRIDALLNELAHVIGWGKELEQVVKNFIDQELDAEDEDDRPTIEDLVAAYESITKPEEVELYGT